MSTYNLGLRRVLGFRVLRFWDLVFRVLGFRVLRFGDLVFRVLGFRVLRFWDLGFRVYGGGAGPLNPKPYEHPLKIGTLNPT